MSMTSRQRIEAALRHQEPDRTPIFEYVLLSPIADQLLRRPFANSGERWFSLIREKGWERAVRQLATDLLDLAALLGHDMLYVVPNPLPTDSPDLVAQPTAMHFTDPVERVQTRNEREARSSPYPTDERLLVYTCLQEEMVRRDLDLPLLAPAYVHGVWTDVDLMQTMLLAPEVAHEHFRLATRRALGSIERYLALGIRQVGVGGDFAGNIPIISPQAYRQFIVPEVRRLSQVVHTAGGWTINASDGNLWPVIEDFLYGCEVDGYLEIDMHAGMALHRLKALYGERVTFYGNLDCGNTLSFAPPEEVRQQVIDCLEAGQGHGGHILCASNAITASVPLRNYLALVNAYREFFGLPRFMLA